MGASCRVRNVKLAERQGFEPWDPVKGQRFSRPPRSTAPASLRLGVVGRIVLEVAQGCNRCFCAIRLAVLALAALSGKTFHWTEGVMLRVLASEGEAPSFICMTRFFRITALVSALCVLAMPLRAQQVDMAQLAATLRLSEWIDVLQDEGLDYGAELRDELFPQSGTARWQRVVEQIYDEPRLLRRFEAVLDAQLARSPQARDEIAAFFSTPPGQQIVGMEIEARRALLDETVEDRAAFVVDRMRATRDPRLALLQRFAEVNDLVEQNVSGALNSNFAFYRGMAEGGAFDADPMTEAEMLDEVWLQEAEIRAETGDWLFPYLALAYQPLSDADLETYIAFSQTEAGQKLNSALFAAYDEVFSAIAYELGRAAAGMLTGQDI
jgi:hypothetical protein